jgi:hypothetical protein
MAIELWTNENGHWDVTKRKRRHGRETLSKRASIILLELTRLPWSVANPCAVRNVHGQTSNTHVRTQMGSKSFVVASVKSVLEMLQS